MVGRVDCLAREGVVTVTRMPLELVSDLPPPRDAARDADDITTLLAPPLPPSVPMPSLMTMLMMTLAAKAGTSREAQD